MALPEIRIAYPDWVEKELDWERAYRTDAERVRLAIEISRLNVVYETGGPFGAAVFERETGSLVSVGMNQVVANNNSILHAEVVAFMMAQARLASFTLHWPNGPAHELATSCEPCAMCLGATLWSGVGRLVCGACREDAERLGFDEGPVFPASHQYLEQRGIEIVREVCRGEAVEVFELYRARGGTIYNS